MGEATRYEVRDGVARIVLDSPANRNALSAVLVGELLEALRVAMRDDGVRCVVLTGNGPAFCAGADLKTRGANLFRESGEESPFVSTLKLLWNGPKPVVAGVNGHAFGGGVGLAAACDISVAASGALFSFSEVRMGLVPATISVVVVPKLGVHQAMRLFLTGERFEAERACELGLIHRVVPGEELEAAVEQEVEAIAKGGPEAIREAKNLVRTVARLPMDEAFPWAESLIARLFASDEAAEGAAAFQEKRPPKWVRTK